ncbi:MAG: hypothetical protein CFE43_12175 [Burkholderiales bacterium PBB3]|nr:MAG: hypothetical protein CFE43_12175 [Burkholderiales bacterium PBB3]
MSRALLLLLGLITIVAASMGVRRCSSNKAPAPAKPALVTPAASTAPAASQGGKPMGYGLTFSMAEADDKDPKDVASLTCDTTGSQTLDRPYKDACNPTVGDTSCRMVLPVLCIKKGSLSRPAPLSGSGWTGGELAATAPVMGAVLDSEMKANVMCERDFGQGWRMAMFSDGRNYPDENGYDHVARGDEWGLQGRVGGSGLGGTARYWVNSQQHSANCWN